MSDKLKAILSWVAVGMTAGAGVITIIIGGNIDAINVQASGIVEVVGGVILLIKNLFNKAT